MSISINIAAIKTITKRDKEHLDIYRMCDNNRVEVPGAVVAYIRRSLGDKILKALDDGCAVKHDGNTVEVLLSSYSGDYEGDPMYGDGAVLQLSDLPEGTVALRVYSSC